MHTYGEFSGGPGSGVYVSRDGGTKWAHIEGHGLPKPPVGKIDVAVAPTNSDRVYALIQTADQGSVWRSDDGGDNWRVVNWAAPADRPRGILHSHRRIFRQRRRSLHCQQRFFQSLDGGENFKEVPWGGDNHDIWVDPKNPDRFALTNDGGMLITRTHGRGFTRVTLPIGQMYHVAVDNQIPYDVYSNMQDDGNMRGPSTSFGFGFGFQAESDWDHGMGGCESGWTLPDLSDPNIVWATCYGDEVTRWDARTKMARSVSPWLHTLDSAPNETKYRCHWTPPLAIDPFDNNTVYYGCQVIFKTTNGGQSWSVISPDLSTNDPSRIVSSGGIVGDNLGQFYGEVVFAIAPSKIQKGLIWAGTNDGQVWYTKDGGGHWNNVTKNISGMPAWGTVTSIEPSHFDAGNRVRLRRFSPDGQPRSLHLQNHRFRPDVDANRQRFPQERACPTSASSRKIRIARACFSPAQEMTSIIRSTMAAIGQLWTQACPTPRYRGPLSRSNSTTWWFPRMAAVSTSSTTSLRSSRWPKSIQTPR